MSNDAFSIWDHVIKKTKQDDELESNQVREGTLVFSDLTFIPQVTQSRGCFCERWFMNPTVGLRGASTGDLNKSEMSYRLCVLVSGGKCVSGWAPLQVIKHPT